jgi:hypothetical protein
VSNSFRDRKQDVENAMKQLRQIETVFADNLAQNKNPLPIFRRGLYDIGDDVDVPLICPTRQVQEAVLLRPRGKSNELIGRRTARQRRIESQGGVDVFRCCHARDLVRLVLCGRP